MSVNINVKTPYSDLRQIFSQRLNQLIDREYGEKRGSKKNFYEDFSRVLENNNIGNGKLIDEAAKKWTTGRGIPQIETLELLAGFFNVSVDYLIGKTDIEASVDEDFIKEYIGLEPHSTRLLREYFLEGYQWQLNTIDALNFLLERKETANILDNMYNYFFGNYTHTENESKTVSLMDKNNHGRELIVSEMQRPVFLSYITLGIADAYDAYVKDNPQYKDYGKPTEENFVMRYVNAQRGTKLERLEKAKKDIISNMEHNQKLFDKYKDTEFEKSKKMYSSLLESCGRCLKIVEDKIKSL